MTLSFAERDLGLLNISLEDGFINLVFLFLIQTLFVKFFTSLSSIE